MTDDQQTRGRPVLKRLEVSDLKTPEDQFLTVLARDGLLWTFCGEFDGSEQKAVDAAHAQCGTGGDIYKVFPSGSWPGGYLRD